MFLVDDVDDRAIGEGIFGGQVNAVEVDQIGTRTPCTRSDIILALYFMGLTSIKAIRLIPVTEII